MFKKHSFNAVKYFMKSGNDKEKYFNFFSEKNEMGFAIDNKFNSYL